MIILLTKLIWYIEIYENQESLENIVFNTETF